MCGYFAWCSVWQHEVGVGTLKQYIDYHTFHDNHCNFHNIQVIFNFKMQIKELLTFKLSIEMKKTLHK